MHAIAPKLLFLFVLSGLPGTRGGSGVPGPINPPNDDVVFPGGSPVAQYCYAYPRLDDPGPLGSADAERRHRPRCVVRHEPRGRSFLTGGLVLLAPPIRGFGAPNVTYAAHVTYYRLTRTCRQPILLRQYGGCRGGEPPSPKTCEAYTYTYQGGGPPTRYALVNASLLVPIWDRAAETFEYQIELGGELHVGRLWVEVGGEGPGPTAPPQAVRAAGGPCVPPVPAGHPWRSVPPVWYSAPNPGFRGLRFRERCLPPQTPATPSDLPRVAFAPQSLLVGITGHTFTRMARPPGDVGVVPPHWAPGALDDGPHAPFPPRPRFRRALRTNPKGVDPGVRAPRIGRRLMALMENASSDSPISTTEEAPLSVSATTIAPSVDPSAEPTAPATTPPGEMATQTATPAATPEEAAVASQPATASAEPSPSSSPVPATAATPGVDRTNTSGIPVAKTPPTTQAPTSPPPTSTHASPRPTTPGHQTTPTEPATPGSVGDPATPTANSPLPASPPATVPGPLAANVSVATTTAPPGTRGTARTPPTGPKMHPHGPTDAPPGSPAPPPPKHRGGPEDYEGAGDGEPPEDDSDTGPAFQTPSTNKPPAYPRPIRPTLPPGILGPLAPSTPRPPTQAPAKDIPLVPTPQHIPLFSFLTASPALDILFIISTTIHTVAFVGLVALAAQLWRGRSGRRRYAHQSVRYVCLPPERD
ncbi:envelope glycoprotein G [Chimpanzee herpesvirus strain 105640]|uniref:Glycoprotein G n=1 Tax=Chimpanzee herpesvirus strain 105640 TaxID=332937 RepID=Q3C1Y4_9ALPH|nr:envelope glycoprotein G [Chimpanzee herpesvirus strain 105640]AFV26953.1 envelope glycoprotein G [Chimpanzee herpesvirus strain 105640]BAE47058.1 glycoprotein G [Chimpanzee herpesvirus strain 105640]